MSDREVVRKVSTSFVPVAVNLYQVREAKDAAGDLFRSYLRQVNQYQGLWLVALDGRVLAAHHVYRSEATWTAEVRATIDAALEAFGPVTPRTNVPRADPLPYRGHGVRPDGSVRLAVTIRLTAGGRPIGDGVLDSIVLPADDWAAFSPPAATPGRTWTLPDRVGRAFSRCLSPASDKSTMPRPEEVTDAALDGRVVEVRGGVARLVYTGRVAAAHAHDGKVARSRARMTSLATYHVATGQMLTLLMLCDGVFVAPPPYAEDKPIAASVEWRAEPAAGRPALRPTAGG